MWREKALAHREGADLSDPHDQIVLDSCAVRIRQLNAEIGKFRDEIARFVKNNYSAKLLLSLTGVDVFAAALLAAEIGDISRFGSPEQLVQWAGMCPTLHQSGDTEYHGRMSKRTNSKMNWVIFQCALTASVHDPRMKKYYTRLRKNHKGIMALANVANKMLTIIWHMLNERAIYEGCSKARYQAKLKKVMSTK